MAGLQACSTVQALGDGGMSWLLRTRQGGRRVRAWPRRRRGVGGTHDMRAIRK